MNDKSLTRQTIAILILSLYTLPFIVLSGWAQMTNDGWSILCAGLLLSAVGTLMMMRYMQLKENAPLKIVQEEAEPKVVEPVQVPDFSPYVEQVEALQKALQEAEQAHMNFKEEYQKISKEKELIQRQAEAHQQEYRLFKKNAQEQHEYHELLLTDHQRTIAELRDTLEKKQQHIQQLESKTRDMNYEIKTLLQLAEKPVMGVFETAALPAQQIKRVASSGSRAQWDAGEPNILDFAVRTHEEAHVHLKRLLDLAQRITGTSLFSSSPRFRELPLDNYALDLRSLFDRLKEITATTIIVYSLKENKLLFVNEQIKELLGLNPDKFVQHFQENVQGGQPEWEDTIRQLTFKNEAKTSLQLKSRTGQEVNVECLLGVVPTGIFRSHIMGLLYKVSLSSKIHKL